MQLNIKAKVMNSRPTSYTEGFKQAKNLTLNANSLENDVYRKKSSILSAYNKAATTTPSGGPLTEIDATIKKELDEIKSELKLQKRYTCLSLSIAVIAMVVLTIAITILHHP